MREHPDRPDRPMLNGRALFLSASCPPPDAMDQFDPPDPDEIDAAISALVHAVLRSRGKIVFGGHPSIAALVQAASQAYLPASQPGRQDLKDREDHPVVMYLSSAFQADLEPITRWLIEKVWVDVRWIDAADGETPRFHRQTGLVIDSVAKSLDAMRRAALTTDNLIGVVFLGGRIGIVKEFDLLMQLKFDHSPPRNLRLRPSGRGRPDT